MVVVVVEVVEVVANCVCIDESGTVEFCLAMDMDISHWTVLVECVSDSEIMEEYSPSAHTQSNINKRVGVQRQNPCTSTQEKK